VVWLGSDGVPDFDALRSRVNDQNAVALAFDVMAVDGDDLRKKRFS
jgi:ATP-dependent DNA ligase